MLQLHIIVQPLPFWISAFQVFFRIDQYTNQNFGIQSHNAAKISTNLHCTRIHAPPKLHVCLPFSVYTLYRRVGSESLDSIIGPNGLVQGLHVRIGTRSTDQIQVTWSNNWGTTHANRIQVTKSDSGPSRFSLCTTHMNRIRVTQSNNRPKWAPHTTACANRFQVIGFGNDPSGLSPFSTCLIHIQVTRSDNHLNGHSSHASRVHRVSDYRIVITSPSGPT